MIPELKEVYNEFMKLHGYINIQGIEIHILEEFIQRDYIKNESLENKVDLMRDFILANDLTEVQE